MYDFSEWSGALKRDPRDIWSKPYGRLPEDHIEELDNLFVPTFQSSEVCANLHKHFISALRRRDPRIAQERQKIYELASEDPEKLGKELCRLKWFSDSASGAIIQGPTGCAKSHITTAYINLLSPLPYIDHGPMPECGWTFLRQIVYLKVYMPSDHSRASFLLAIMQEIERVLGPIANEHDYLKKFTREKNIESKLLYVLKVLMIHRCGMLFVEESQEQNFANAEWAGEFRTFFLRILNCGIPLVLIGNPLAFENLVSSSQARRRLAKGGMFNFVPAYDHTNAQWKKAARSIWAWTIFDQPDSYIPSDELLYERSAGFYGYLAQYRKEVLTFAHRMGDTTVNQMHFEAAWRSSVMTPFHDIISAYVQKKSKLLVASDEPRNYMVAEWKKEAELRGLAEPSH